MNKSSTFSQKKLNIYKKNSGLNNPKKVLDKFSNIPEALEALKKGDMLIVVDDKTRENQGDIIFPAETITTEKANFLMKEARGMFCVPMHRDQAFKLELIPMIALQQNTEKLRCNFTITVDAKEIKDHGISASDRTLTVKKLVDKKTKPEDLLKPGHVSPIIAADGGVLERNGHTEAAVDLSILAGFAPVGVLSEIINDKGVPTVGEELFTFAKKHNLKIITIADLVKYRETHPFANTKRVPIVKKISEAELPTKFGMFTISIYKDLRNGKEHAILTTGDLKEPVLTRIHSKCLTGDTFSSLRCDCQEQLHKSMEAVQKNGSGVIIYHNEEGRGIGLANKIKAYTLQEQGFDTVEANISLGFASDERNYYVAADILHDLGISKINLLTNNPEKSEAMEHCGINVVKRISIETAPNKYNKKYLETKKEKMHHQLTEV